MASASMSRGSKLLERVRANPRDWRMSDVMSVCVAMGVSCVPPRKGSHYKVSHASQNAILTVPAHNPVKAVYIKKLIAYLDAVDGAMR
jgi:predicted RNA binding protein YcfA (HicA-like mRNA interferase family)